MDRPTFTTLGVQLPLSGDDNFNAAVTLRYRVTGTSAWQNGLPLFRVHPETVAYYTVTPQFAGSIFDLRPATSYDIELHAVDPDGTDQIFTLSATTRSLPADPVSPRIVNVVDANSLTNALGSAQPGDIILLANGVYPGQFDIYSGGTAGNPIVIRGASEDGVVLDGGDCTGCNILEVYGAGYLHIENMTIQNGERAIRFQSNGAIANTVRHVHVKNTTLGIGGKAAQYDFYIADNILEGQLLWPHIYTDDNGLYSGNDGIAVSGFGHVVAHNQISGYGDAMKTILDGARANDFYGNDIVFTYDNGIELDGSEGNTRAFRNRFMNTYEPLSVQPIHGGPSYLLRNVVVNAAGEQLKFHLHANPSQEPSGVLVYHNTFVSPYLELTMQTTATSHYFAIENNLFIAPRSTGQQVVEWLGIDDHGTFDYNGYFPDGLITFHNPPPAGYLYVNNFAGLAGTGYETHGLLANGLLFSNGLTGPSSYTIQMPPADATLAPGTAVQDKGLVLPNVNDNFTGSGPDLGALEIGCPNPSYGPRPPGVDESNEILGCAPGLTVTAVSISPSSQTLGPNGIQQFTATTTPAGAAVSWQIYPARGFISSTGLYTAPANALLGEVVTVMAVSVANPGAVASAKVTLSNTVQIVASPTPVTVTQDGGTVQFSATVTGAIDTGVTWRMESNYGTISATGLYTAPTPIKPGWRVTAIAASLADPTKTASVHISFAAPVVVISPATPTIHGGGYQQFSATVAGVSSNVNWSLSPALGTISRSGWYTAPSVVTAPVTVTVTATSQGTPAGVGVTKISLVP